MSIRFEVVEDEDRKFPLREIVKPTRSTRGSAGYDFLSNEDVTVAPGERHIFFTDVTINIPQDFVLKVYIRSSLGIKVGLKLCNQVGVIDSDYYPNNIAIAIENDSEEEVGILTGHKIAQGVIEKYYITDDDEISKTRKGGIGSTGK